MNYDLCDELEQAKKLIKENKVEKALEIVTSLLAKKNLSEQDLFHSKLIHSEIKLLLGEHKLAEEIVDSIIEQVNEYMNPLLFADFHLIKIAVMWHFGRYDEGLTSITQIQSLLLKLKEKKDYIEEFEIEKRLQALLRNRGIIHWYLGDLDKAEKDHKESLKLCKKFKIKKRITNCYNNLGLVYWSRGDYKKASEYYEKGLTIIAETGNIRQISIILNNLGNVYALQGELEKGLDYHERSLKLKEELGNKRDIALSLTNMGSLFQTIGNINGALEYYLKGLGYYIELNDRRGLSLTFNNLGSAHEIKGDLDLSLKYHQKSLAIRQELNNNQEIAMSLLNIGKIHQIMGDFDKALEILQQGLVLYEESGNELYIGLALYRLITAFLDNNQSEQAIKFLEKLHKLSKKSENKIIKQRYKIAHAILLKNGGKPREKLQAQEIFHAIIQEKVVDHRLTITAMIHLCDLLLFELKITDDEEILKRVNEITERLIDIGNDQGSYSLLIETYILQSKLALFEKDVEKARILLTQAHITAEEKGLYLLVQKIEYEQDLLKSQIKTWQELIHGNPSKQQLADLANLDDFIERMIRKTVSILTNEEKGITGGSETTKKYSLEYHDVLDPTLATERNKFRIGISQMGLSLSGDIISEFYEEKGGGLLAIKRDKIEGIRSKIKEMIDNAHKENIDILIFPEMSIDLNYDEFQNDLLELAKKHDMYIIPGSFHDDNSKKNLCKIISPEGFLWEQYKHIPAIIHIEGKRFTEGIRVEDRPKKTVVCNTKFGRIAIAICRDFLDMDLRVELKNFNPPIDIVINPAFTPVTADFKAAHFDARRSIYAYCCFANIGEFGDSLIYSPERDRTEKIVLKGEEGIIYKDVDLFQLRSEREKWEKIQKSQRSFIQSTKM